MTSILVIADTHIGRYPSKIDPNQSDCTVRAVWRNAINGALEQGVDAVVLTGDILDQDNKYFEAYGDVRWAVSQLDAAGIDTFAVAGNHDYDVFPRLVDNLQCERLHLLGRDGKWSSMPLEKDGKTRARFLGWSFPSDHYESSPLESVPSIPNDVPVVGIVHGDLGQSSSRYAPLDLQELQAAPVAIWLLGHVHRPNLIAGGTVPVLYPGSLQALDPGEEGTHGPWLVKLDEETGTVSAEQIPLASVRYETIEVDVTEAKRMADVESMITQAVSEVANKLGHSYDMLRHVSLRVSLTGTTPLHRELSTRSWSESSNLGDDSGLVPATVDKVLVNTQPKRNLVNIAKRSDPPGTLAQWILELQRVENGAEPSPSCAVLLDNTRTEIAKIQDEKTFRRLQNEPSKVTPADAAKALIKQGTLLLDALMAQKESEND